MITHICLKCGKVIKTVHGAEEGVSHGYCSDCEDAALIKSSLDYAVSSGEYGPAVEMLAHPWPTLKANWLALCALAYLAAQILRSHKFFGF